MLSQLSQAIKFEAFYTASKTGATGKTVTVDVYRGSTQVVTGASATEIGGGLYSYTLASGSVTTNDNYVAIFKTSDTTVDLQHIPSFFRAGENWVERVDRNVSDSYNRLGAPAGASIAADIAGKSTFNAASDTVTLKNGTHTGAVIPTVTTLTNAPSDSSGTTTLLSRIASALTITSGKVDVNDKTGFSLATAPPTAADIATAVWAAGTRSLTTFGTLVADVWAYATRIVTGVPATVATEANVNAVGAAVLTRATPADVDVDVTVDGGFTTQDRTDLQATKAKLLALGSARVTFTSPVIDSDTVQIKRGDSYSGARALSWTVSKALLGIPDADEIDAIEMKVDVLEDTFAGAAASQTDDDVTVQVPLTSAQTSEFPLTTANFDLQFTVGDETITAVEGQVTTRRDNAP